MASVFGHGCLNLSTVNIACSDVFVIRILCHLCYFYMDHIHFLSLNCHGLSSDIISYLRSVVCNYDFIILQETWLSHANSHRLGDISNDFVYFHSSAMEDRLLSGVFSGRPFGGTAILVRSVFFQQSICS